ncbi:MAG: alpha/beta hydrolase [Bacteroidota bacterium]
MDTTTLVLLHAFPLCSVMWEPQRRAFEGTVPLYLPDLPGFGTESRLDGERFSMKLAARFIQHELDARKIDRCVLGGLSMGGYIAFECWRLFPERIAGMILADTRASSDTGEGRSKRFDSVVRIGQGDFPGFVEDTLKMLLAKETWNNHPEVVEVARILMRTTDPQSVIEAQLGLAERPDSTATLGTITVPTAVIAGRHDAIVPIDEAREMAAAIPGAGFTIIERAGHLSNLENPEDFNAAVLGLLARVDGR